MSVRSKSNRQTHGSSHTRCHRFNGIRRQSKSSKSSARVRWSATFLIHRRVPYLYDDLYLWQWTVGHGIGAEAPKVCLDWNQAGSSPAKAAISGPRWSTALPGLQANKPPMPVEPPAWALSSQVRQQGGSRLRLVWGRTMNYFLHRQKLQLSLLNKSNNFKFD